MEIHLQLLKKEFDAMGTLEIFSLIVDLEQSVWAGGSIERNSDKDLIDNFLLFDEIISAQLEQFNPKNPLQNRRFTFHSSWNSPSLTVSEVES